MSSVITRDPGTRLRSGDQSPTSSTNRGHAPDPRHPAPDRLLRLSRPAFELACALARDYSARLLIIHVVSPPRAFAPDGIAMPLPIEEPYETHARLARFRPADPRVKVEHRLLEGEPAEEILKAAEEIAALIVLGTHGATGLMRLLTGSVAESVMRKALCPVLTVRAPFHLSPTHPARVEQHAPAN